MIFTNNLQWWETDEQWLETRSVRDDPPQGSRDFIYTEINLLNTFFDVWFDFIGQLTQPRDLNWMFVAQIEHRSFFFFLRMKWSSEGQ